MKHLIIIFIAFSSLLATKLFAQEESSFFKEPQEFTIASPEMASLGKFGMIPVGKYTGAVNVSVPIYTINFDGLSIPIQLSYHGGGVRVAEEATWVGLGWNLSANTAVTRSINGKDDLLASWGYPYMPPIPLANEPWTNYDAYYSGNAAAPSGNGERDTEPDLFVASLFGASFKFILEKPGGTPTASTTLNGKPLNNKRMKVQYKPYLDGSQIDGFLVTDDKGFRYVFESKEYAYNLSGTPGNENYRSYEGGVITGWQIVKIISPRGREMSFQYSNPGEVFLKSQTLTNMSGETNVSGFCGGTTTTFSVGTTEFSSFSVNAVVYLTGITYEDLQVTFHSSANREDLVILPTNFTQVPQIPNTFREPPQRLDHIEVTRSGTSILDAYLSYSYFNQDDISNPDKDRYLRLKLDQVQVQDQFHNFDYIQPDDLPVKNSTATDHWGFYNGQDANGLLPELLFRMQCAPNDPIQCGISLGSDLTSSDPLEICGDFVRFSRGAGQNPYILFPQTSPCAPTGDIPAESYLYDAPSCLSIWSSYYFLEGADKNADFTYGKIGLLERITYPTKGSTEFVYEGNEVKMPFAQEYNGLEIVPTSEVNEYIAKDINTCYGAANPGISPTFTISQPLISTGSGSGGGIWVRNTCPYYDPTTGDVTPGFTCGEQSHPPCAGATDKIAWEIIDAGNGNVVAFGDFDYSPYSFQKIQLSSPLPTGSYYLTAYSNYEIYKTEIIARIPKNIDANDPQNGMAFNNVEVGGARINSIKDFDHDGSLQTERYFQYLESDTPCSSGILMNPIKYAHAISYYNSVTTNPYPDGFTQRFSLGTNNKMAVQNSAQGNHVGYSRVLEIQTGSDATDDEEATTISTFHNAPNFYTFIPFPDLPPITSQIANGSLKKEISLKGKINPLPVQEVNNVYNYVVDEYILATRTMRTATVVGTVMSYKIREEAYLPIQTRTKVYDENGINYVETIQNTVYQSDFHLPKTVTTFGSDGTEQISQTSYLQEYSSSLGSYTGTDPDVLALKSLYDQNIYTPIETRQYVNHDGTEKLTGASHMKFKDYNGIILPHEAHAVETESPIPSGNFFPPYIVNGGGIVYDNTYELQGTYEDYGNKGNLLEFSQDHGQPNALIWGYNAQLPMAKVVNASYDEVAFTSFESVHTGRWTFLGNNIQNPAGSKTGKYSYDLDNGGLRRAGLPAGEYLISYWTKGGTGAAITSTGTDTEHSGTYTDSKAWTYYEKRFTLSSPGQIDVFGSAWIDELRVQPYGSIMTSYCYNDKWLISTETDQNHMSVNYEYDVNNRLVKITDQDGNLLQTYDYHFKQ